MNVTTPVFRVSYPNLFQAKENKLSGKLEYSVQALFPKGADLSKMKAAAMAAGVKKWGEDTKKWPKQKNSPFRDQAERAKDGKLPPECEAGGIFMNFKSKDQPQVVDQQLNSVLDKTKVYAGCYAKANVTAFAYSQLGNSGISFSLNSVQFVKDGEPLGSRPRIEDAFQPIEIENNSTGADASSIF
jgi:hypothetical protein